MLKIGDIVRIKNSTKRLNNKLAIVLSDSNKIGLYEYYLVTLKDESIGNYYNFPEKNLIKVKSLKNKLK